MDKLSPNFQYILLNTPWSYPLAITKEQALKYLTLISREEFLYNNVHCYDAIDYQKLIFLEMHFANDSDIQEKILSIKNDIAIGYKIQNQYRNRIMDMPENDMLSMAFWKEGFYGIPRD